MMRLHIDPRRGLLLVALSLSLPLLFCACSDDDPVTPDPGEEEPTIRQVTHEFYSYEYLRNRIFRLDLPEVDEPGRGEGWWIDLSTISVFLAMPTPGLMDEIYIENLAVYVDTTGVFWSGDGSPTADFQNPYAAYSRARPLEFDLHFDGIGNFVWIDLGDGIADDALLGVAYRITNGYENIHVGDIPGADEDSREEIDGEPYYRMKLLKAPANHKERATFELMQRNVYQLCPSISCLPEWELRIERTDQTDDPDVDIYDIPYVTIFGLDRYTETYRPVPDGVADFLDDELFDFPNRLLVFPSDLPHPFAAEPAQYEAYAANGNFDFWNSELSDLLTPEIYDPETLPADYDEYGTFRFVFTYWEWIPEAREALGEVDLSRLPWMRAAVPLRADVSSPVYTPESRVEAIRWFPPREVVQADYLRPGKAETVEALELYLWAEDGSWDEGDWGGVSRSVSQSGVDVSEADSVRIWVNDFTVDPSRRSGTLHIDYGWISEDGFWPVRHDSLVVGEWEHEDGILGFEFLDGVFTQDEDIGLDGDDSGREVYDASYDYEGTTTLYTGETVQPDYAGPSSPYPLLNGTARNNREDDEDLNGDGSLATRSAYRSIAIELNAAADYDLLRDGPAGDVAEAIAAGRAWRRYTIPLSAAIDLTNYYDYTEVNPRGITHLRLWFEDPGRSGAAVQLQIAQLEFFGGEKSRVVPGLGLYGR